MNKEQELQDAYESAVRSMAYHGKTWMDGNKGKVKIHMNLPASVAVAMSIEDAVGCHFLSVNQDAEAMIKQMTCETPGATVMMLRMALELIHQELKG